MSLFSSVLPKSEDPGMIHPRGDHSEVGVDLADLSPSRSVHFWNQTNIDLHQVLEAVLQKTGPAEILLCSWSISVPAMKVISRLISSGLIRSVLAVVDFRTRKDHPEAFAMAKELFAGVKILPCHAKCIVVLGENFSASITGSANLTNNPKQERLMVSTHDQVVDLDKSTILEMYARGES